jgi:hypothetical protein
MNDFVLKKLKECLEKNGCAIYQAPHGYNRGSVQEICPSITISSWESNKLLIEKVGADNE